MGRPPQRFLEGWAEEAPVVLAGDGGSLCQLLELEGMGGAAIPYLRFVEVNLQIPGIRNYNEDALLLVIPTMTYSMTVLVVVGTKVIDKALSLMIVGKLAKATTIWRQTHFGAVMSGLLQLSHISSDKSEMTKEASWHHQCTGQY